MARAAEPESGRFPRKILEDDWPPITAEDPTAGTARGAVLLMSLPIAASNAANQAAPLLAVARALRPMRYREIQALTASA